MSKNLETEIGLVQSVILRENNNCVCTRSGEEIPEILDRHFSIQVVNRIDAKSHSKFVVVIKSKINNIIKEFDATNILEGDKYILSKLMDIGHITPDGYKLLQKYIENIKESGKVEVELVSDVMASLGMSKDVVEDSENFYLDLMDEIKANSEILTFHKEKYNKEMLGVIEKNFRGCGTACLLIDGDALLEELGFEMEEKLKNFKMLMDCWAKAGYLYAPNKRANTARNTVKYKLDKTIAYAVILPSDIVEYLQTEKGEWW